MADDGKLIAVIGDEDTVTGFLLAGVGQRDSKGANFLVVDAKTQKETIEQTFNSYLTRGDVGLIIMNQPIADSIRPLLESHKAPVPMVLELPTTGAPFDPNKDPLMKRVMQMLGEQ